MITPELRALALAATPGAGWTCWRCEQRNAGWTTTCGRCELDRITPERILALIACIEAAKSELQIIANADPFTWEPDVRDHFQAWAQNRASAALAALEKEQT